MDVPILKQGDYLIAIDQVGADRRATSPSLRERSVERVGRFRSRGVIVDVTALDVMDSFAARTLRDLAHMTRLRGAETVIVGIQPRWLRHGPAGLTLEGVATALDLEEDAWLGAAPLTPAWAEPLPPLVIAPAAPIGPLPAAALAGSVFVRAAAGKGVGKYQCQQQRAGASWERGDHRSARQDCGRAFQGAPLTAGAAA